GAGQRIPEADPDALEAGIGTVRRGHQPLESVLGAGIGQREIGVEPPRAEQDGRRGRAHRFGERPYRDLLEVAIVEPYLGAVGHHQLLVGRDDLPAEAPGALEGEPALAALDAARCPADGLLGEVAARGRRAGEETIEGFDGAGGPGQPGAEGEYGGERQRAPLTGQARDPVDAHEAGERPRTPRVDPCCRDTPPQSSSPVLPGTRMSRLPLVAIGDTRPACSICSSSRAARY